MTPPSAPYAGELGPPVEPGSDLVAVGPCGLCGRPFAFDPATVPAMRLDPDTGLPPDVGGTDAAAAVAHPLCEGCVAAGCHGDQAAADEERPPTDNALPGSFLDRGDRVLAVWVGRAHRVPLLDDLGTGHQLARPVDDTGADEQQG